MNQAVAIREHAPMQSFGLVPTTMGDAMKLAEMMAGAKLVPAALQKSPADCLMVIQQAVRWDMDPFAVAQECSVIQGKLMHSGKLVAAVVNARGNLTQRLSFTYSGKGEDRAIVVSGQLQGEAEPRTVDVTLKQARTANAMWTKQPDQQLMYHGTRVWARRHTPELMLGVYSPEEFDEPQAQARRPKPPAANVMLPAHDAETGEITEEASSSQEAADQGASSDPSPADGAPKVPTAEDYVEAWSIRLDNASNAAHGEQIRAQWDSEKKVRRLITWPEDDTFDQLKTRVGKAIKFLAAA